MKKFTDIINTVFGYGIMIILLAGGLLFFGYIAALLVGGETASVICALIYTKIYPVLVIATTSLILLGLIKMYLAGEVKSTKKKAENKAENK